MRSVITRDIAILLIRKSDFLYVCLCGCQRVNSVGVDSCEKIFTMILKIFLMLDILSWQLELSDLLADVERVTPSTETIWTVLQRFCPLFKIAIHLYPSWHIFTACISACFFSGMDWLSPLIFCHDSRDYTCSDQALCLISSSDTNISFCLLYIFSHQILWALCSFCLKKINQAMRLSLVSQCLPLWVLSVIFIFSLVTPCMP